MNYWTKIQFVSRTYCRRARSGVQCGEINEPTPHRPTEDPSAPLRFGRDVGVKQRKYESHSSNRSPR
jgi:hypothetical protein